jgi:hypothetical protein
MEFINKFPVYHFTSTKNCGDLKDEYKRNKFCKRNKIDTNSLVTGRQVHGRNIKIVEKKDIGKNFADTDGFITRVQGAALAIFTADCMPVFLADKQKRVAGLVHAGWRGLKAGIIIDAVKILKKRFKIKPKDISVYIGPHIQKCCYSVGDELKEAFGLAKNVRTVSLAKIAAAQLKKMGIKDISLSKHCTCHENKLFFSFRKNKTGKRMMSLIRI